MTKRGQEILQQALQLDANERAEVAAQLLGSLDPPPEPDIDALWEEEVGRRLADFEAGKVKPIPWSEVRQVLKLQDEK